LHCLFDGFSDPWKETRIVPKLRRQNGTKTSFFGLWTTLVRDTANSCVDDKQPAFEGQTMNRILRKAMQDADNYVIEMDYSDAKGNRTHRIVSPIRFMGSYRFLGLCLCREQPRQFQLSRCKNIRLMPASEVLMPVTIQAEKSLSN
jgi:predicted DNA-binding transcriptional regulator YafY